MAKSTPRQRKTEGRVMHEFAHGQLRSGPGGKGGKVANRKQAIAIALNEAGASTYKSAAKNQRRFAQSKAKEARGKTAQQEAEGKSHLGAAGKRESSPAMGGKNATSLTKRSAKAVRSRRAQGATKDELYAQAKRQHIAGRSKMSKQQLENALH
jgi:hypothetical protein